MSCLGIFVLQLTTTFKLVTYVTLQTLHKTWKILKFFPWPLGFIIQRTRRLAELRTNKFEFICRKFLNISSQNVSPGLRDSPHPAGRGVQRVTGKMSGLFTTRRIYSFLAILLGDRARNRWGQGSPREGGGRRRNAKIKLGRVLYSSRTLFTL